MKKILTFLLVGAMSMGVHKSQAATSGSESFVFSGGRCYHVAEGTDTMVSPSGISFKTVDGVSVFINNTYTEVDIPYENPLGGDTYLQAHVIPILVKMHYDPSLCMV